MPRFYLTTAIDYVNNRPHLGTAYEKVAADVIARYKRLAGFDVRFVMGNDEHSQNVFRRAAEEGLSPIAYCDRMEQEFRQAWKSLDLSFDDFIRTTEPRHAAAVTEITSRLHAAGDIYQGVYEGWYCVGCEAFKQDKDLVDGRCPLHPQLEPSWLKEDNYFFRLSRYQRPLLDHFAAHPEFLQPDVRRNEILRLIESGLDDISISRAGQAWGIPLPFDQRSVVYVWFDALVNYASAVGLGTDPALFDTWWPADLHVIGKDITRFHAVIWPAMLMAAGLPLPRRIHGHGFLTKDGQRMSKSNPGTIIDPAEAAARHGADPLRLYLTKEVAFGSDGDFSWSRFEEKYNADLANNLGNLVNRVTAMAERYRQGRLTGSSGPSRLRDELATTVGRYQAAMDELALDRGCQEAFRVVDAANEFIASSEPWALAKRGDAAALDDVLWASAEALRLAAVLISPVMPRASETILARLDAPVRHAGDLNLARDAVFQTSGTRQVLRGSALWPRLEPAGAVSPTATTETTHEAAARNPSKAKESAVSAPESSTPRPDPPAAAPASTPAPAGAAASAPAAASTDGRISIDDLMKIDLRVARVLAAERVPNSKKLLKLQIDLGTEQRTIVAGIAEAYEADALVGRSVAIVANLKPAKLMGIESNGMVLAASPEGGKPILVAFDQPPPPGSRVR
ncbi:MAG TPA: methionine--tRNA ligase [Vicinamibacterales bacterium]|nr:methionine--tRNA ligase [Vicinamibacterales bacterium]